MYWNVVKRRTDNKEYVKIIKTYNCFGRSDYDMKYKADRLSSFLNMFRWWNNKYYYVTEFDFE